MAETTPQPQGSIFNRIGHSVASGTARTGPGGKQAKYLPGTLLFHFRPRHVPEEAARLIRQGMDRMAVILGDAKKLKDAISAPQPSNQDIRIVKHSRSNEFVIASIPNSMAEAADCSRMERGEDLSFDEDQEKVYGDYYAIGFQMEATVEDAGVLWTIWQKEKGECYYSYQ